MVYLIILAVSVTMDKERTLSMVSRGLMPHLALGMGVLLLLFTFINRVAPVAPRVSVAGSVRRPAGDSGAD